jgi:hypothetical protein
MRKTKRGGATFTTVIAGAAVLAVFGTGTAVAGGLITSAKIKNDTVKSIDVRNNNLAGVDVKDGSLTGADLASKSVPGDRIADFSLSNQAVGVLFAQVNADGTVANSSGDVTVDRKSVGEYAVDFGRDVSNCAFVASVGDATAGVTTGSAIQATDKSDNPAAVFVKTADRTGTTDLDRPFTVIVVC